MVSLEGPFWLPHAYGLVLTDKVPVNRTTFIIEQNQRKEE